MSLPADVVAPAARPRPPLGLPPALWCGLAAFSCYFCMYGFRKPFTAGRYDGELSWGTDTKTVLVVAQVLGYTLSKFLGIKFASEVRPARRAAAVVGLVLAAELALVLFGLTPAPWGAVWLFANGLPLGMVFGVVIGFLEGRRHTEALAAGLCASFVVADGVTKTVGAELLRAGVAEGWMPALAGALFLPPLVLSVAVLARVPPPSPSDVAARGARRPMDSAERRAFFRRHAAGLVPLVGAYLLVTVLRSVRADFAPELWAGLGVAAPDPAVYAGTELSVGLGVLVVFAGLVLVRDNRAALLAAFGVAVAGSGLVALCLVGLGAGALGPFAFVALLGLGLYLPYIAVQTVVCERLVALTRDGGTVAYVVSLADAFGYLGYVAVLLARKFGGGTGEFLGFFVATSWVAAAGSALLLVVAGYFLTRRRA